MKIHQAFCTFIIASAASLPAAEQSWPQWRGPLQTGAAPEADPPMKWSESENIGWKLKLPGSGSATPIVWGNSIFVQTAIPTGKKGEPAKVDAPTTPPPQSRPDGPGGRDGFGPGNILAERLIADGDKNNDKKLSKDELVTVAGGWFEKLDPDKAGKLNREQFASQFGSLTAQPPPGNSDGGEPGGPGGGRGNRGSGRFMAPGLFDATDSDKNGTLTKDEFTQSFAKWFTEWDKDKSGNLDANHLREGLNAALPRPQFGGPGGPGRGGPGRGRGGVEKPTELYQFAVLCVDAATGKIAWQKTAREEVPHEGFHQEEGSFAAPSGVTDGKHYFAFFGSRGLYSYDFQGKQEWSKDLGKMRIAMGFGEGSSLAIHKDVLVVKWDNEDGSFITAIDKNSGKTLWQENRDEGTSWSSPLIVEHNGRAEVITSATRKIRSYELNSGKILWECGGLTRNVIPTPVADTERVYCMSGFMGNSLIAIKLGGSGDLTGSDSIAWTYKKSTPYVPSPLLSNGKLYFLAGNNGVISYLDAATGKVLVDAERLEGLSGSYVSPIAAGGRIYIAGRNGSTVVLKQSDNVEILATNHLDDRFDASPVAFGKNLLLRGRENLYLIAQK